MTITIKVNEDILEGFQKDMTETDKMLNDLLDAAEAVINDTTIDHEGAYNEDVAGYELSNKNTVDCLQKEVEKINNRLINANRRR